MTLPFNATFAATFPDNLPVANWSGGNPKFFTYGVGTTVANNKLGGSATVAIASNTSVNRGSIVVKMIAKYTGTPPIGLEECLYQLNGTSGGNWAVSIVHRFPNTLRVYFTVAGVLVHTSSLIWTSVAGEAYEFKFTWDYAVAKKFRLFIGEVSKGFSTLFLDLNTTLIMPVLTPYPIPLVDMVSFARDSSANVNYPGYKFYDLLMYDVVIDPTDTLYYIQNDYIPDIKPPLALPECAVYGRVLYNNTPVTDATITFKPASTFIYLGVIANYTKVLTTDSTGYFEATLPVSGITKCKYKCTFTVGGIVYSKSGELTIPTEEFLIIQ